MLVLFSKESKIPWIPVALKFKLRNMYEPHPKNGKTTEHHHFLPLSLLAVCRNQVHGLDS
jgi:hypothetical protein